MPAHSSGDFADNPYSAPNDDLEKPEIRSESEMERIRNANLAHEGMVQWVGAVFLFVGVIFLAVAILSGAFLFKSEFQQVGETSPTPTSRDAGNAEVLRFLLLVSGISVPIALALGQNLLLLQNWARISAGFLSIPGLILFPFGTIVFGIILYILFSPKGAYVCSHKYRDVMVATPEIRYKTALIIRIFVGLFFVLFVSAILLVTVAMLFPPRKS